MAIISLVVRHTAKRAFKGIANVNVGNKFFLFAPCSAFRTLFVSQYSQLLSSFWYCLWSPDVRPPGNGRGRLFPPVVNLDRVMVGESAVTGIDAVAAEHIPFTAAVVMPV